MSDHRSSTADPCLSEADFHECLVRFFRPFVSVRPVDWTCIQKSETYFAPCFRFEELLDVYFEFIFGLFEDFRITDGEVALSCVKKYCRFQLTDCEYRNGHPYELSFLDRGVPFHEYIQESLSLESLLSWPLNHRKLSSVVNRILRYVAPVTIEWEDLQDIQNGVRYSINWKDPLSPVLCYPGDYKDDTVSCRRLKLIFIVLDSILQVRIKNHKDAIERVKILFQSIPDCHITWLEIFRFLTNRIMPLQNKLPYIRSFQESCMGCFPECLQVLKPRSLQHLARCEVRRCLGRAHTLPHGVWSLRLPRKLQDYVLLQTRKDQFWPVIRPLSSERVFVLGPVPKVQDTLGLGSS